MKPLRCLFVVQGEGRGHMTQALALRRLLARAGHTVAGVLVTRSPHRQVPRFFLDKIEAPVTYLDSPNFVPDADGRGVHRWATFVRGMRFVAACRQSLRTIGEAMQRYEPDVVINFFEPVVGAYYLLRRPRVPMVCIAHQYLLLHPSYVFPPGEAFQRLATQTFIRLTSAGAVRRLALSHHPAADCAQRRISVVPPLLREDVFKLPLNLEEDFLLVYILNSGYAEELIEWHRRRPEVRLHCFWDRPDAAPVERYDDTLTFHQINDETFLHLMARCRGLVCTAGFESVGEAMHLGKPVQVVPVGGHFEQRCNALDAARVGAGIRGRSFDLDAFLGFIPRYACDTEGFRAWLATAETRFVQAIEKAAGRPPRTPSVPTTPASARPATPVMA